MVVPMSVTTQQRQRQMRFGQAGGANGQGFRDQLLPGMGGMGNGGNLPGARAPQVCFIWSY